jgi:putative membrane protein
MNQSVDGGGLLARTSNRSFYVFNAVLSACALAFLAWILVIRRGGDTGLDLRFLPPVNASLNATAAVLLTAGWIAIRRGERTIHKYMMVSAFVASSLFLVCYLAYHYVHGDTKYAGHGPLRAVYLLILATHILLSMTIVPLSMSAFFFAYKGRFGTHKKIGKVTLPIWLYVSVTGVVIYFMLRGSLPSHP